MRAGLSLVTGVLVAIACKSPPPGYGKEAPPTPESSIQEIGQTKIDFVGVLRVRDLVSCVAVGPGSSGAPQCDGFIGALWDVELEETLWGQAPAAFRLASHGNWGEYVPAYLEYSAGRQRRFLVSSRSNVTPVPEYRGLATPPGLCGKELPESLGTVVDMLIFHPDGSDRLARVNLASWKERHRTMGLQGDEWSWAIDASDIWVDDDRFKDLVRQRYTAPRPADRSVCQCAGRRCPYRPAVAGPGASGSPRLRPVHGQRRPRGADRPGIRRPL